MTQIEGYNLDVNKHFALYQDESDADTVLFVLFENRTLLYEKELDFDSHLEQNILYEIQCHHEHQRESRTQPVYYIPETHQNMNITPQQ